MTQTTRRQISETTVSDAIADMVSVVVVTYNSAAVITQCLSALTGLRHVYVVDNASHDNSVNLAQATLPHAKIIRSPDNIGFGCANNLALTQLDTPFALLINPDCILNNEALVNLVEAASRYPDAAAISAQLKNPDGKSEKSYDRAFYLQGTSAPYIEVSGDTCADFLVGTGILLRVSMMKPLGFFDPKIFMYYEDADLCLRARARGHALILAGNAQMQHLGGKSSPPSALLTFKKYFYEMHSRLYVLSKHRGKATARLQGIQLALSSLIKLPVYALTINRTLAIRSAARIAAILRRPWEN